MVESTAKGCLGAAATGGLIRKPASIIEVDWSSDCSHAASISWPSNMLPAGERWEQVECSQVRPDKLLHDLPARQPAVKQA